MIKSEFIFSACDWSVGSIHCHLLFIFLFCGKGGFTECQKILKENLSEVNDSPDVKYINAVLQYYLDNFDTAKLLLNEVLSTAPDHHPSKLCLDLISR